MRWLLAGLEAHRVWRIIPSAPGRPQSRRRPASGCRAPCRCLRRAPSTGRDPGNVLCQRKQPGQHAVPRRRHHPCRVISAASSCCTSDKAMMVRLVDPSDHGRDDDEMGVAAMPETLNPEPRSASASHAPSPHVCRGSDLLVKRKRLTRATYKGDSLVSLVDPLDDGLCGEPVCIAVK